MEELIQHFNEAKISKDHRERTSRRNDVVKKMLDQLSSQRCIYDIDETIADTGGDLGRMMFVMALIHHKLDKFQESYHGATATDSVIFFLLHTVKTCPSFYVQQVAREQLLRMLVDGMLSAEQTLMVRVTAVDIIGVSDIDTPLRREWVYLVLLNGWTDNDMSKDSLLGCMIGQCVGDALGFIVEGYGPQKCTEFVEKFVKTRKVPTWERSGLTFGQYSDASQLAREFLLSYLENGGMIKGSTYARRIGNMFQPNNYRVVGFGKTWTDAGEALFKGGDYRKTGCFVSQGNGSAMRSAPIGVMFTSRSAPEVIDIARKLSSITHAHKRCMAGAAAIALAAKFMTCCRAVDFDVYAFVQYVGQTGDDKMNQFISQIPEMLKWSVLEVCNYCVRVGVEDGEGCLDGVGEGVIQTVLWSLYCVCKHPNSYMECIALAIQVGGDVDTIAGIAGALVGTRLGLKAIPAVWRKALHDMDEWTYNDLCIIAEDVVRTSRRCLATFDF